MVLIMNIKHFIYCNKKHAIIKFKKLIHAYKLTDSPYWNEYDKFYNNIDYNNKVVIDIGADIGSSAMYFLQHGANHVYGFSLDKQYFKNKNYTHYKYSIEKINYVINNIMPYYMATGNNLILKMDCEGCEWNFTIDFIKQFSEWIIALHNPIMNNELYDYILQNGHEVGYIDNIEFAIMQNLNTINR